MVLALSALLVGWLYPCTAPAEGNEIIEQKIEQKASDNIRLRETRVTIDVMDGCVVLRGTVGLYIQKMIFERIAWKTKGVVEVDNEIRVVPVLPAIDGAIKRRISKILHAQDISTGVVSTIAVQSGVVSIQATFGAIGDVRNLKHKIGEIQGVVGIHIRADFLSYVPYDCAYVAFGALPVCGFETL